VIVLGQYKYYSLNILTLSLKGKNFRGVNKSKNALQFEKCVHIWNSTIWLKRFVLCRPQLLGNHTLKKKYLI